MKLQKNMGMAIYNDWTDGITFIDVIHFGVHSCGHCWGVDFKIMGLGLGIRF